MKAGEILLTRGFVTCSHAMDKRTDDPPPQAKSDARLREERSFLHYAILFYGVGILFLLLAAISLACRLRWYSAFLPACSISFPTSAPSLPESRPC